MEVGKLRFDQKHHTHTLDNGSDSVLLNVLCHHQRPTYMEMDLFMEADLFIDYTANEK